MLSTLLKNTFVAAFLTLFSLSSAAQLPKLCFRQYGTNDGLPSSQVYQVLQDKSGYLWFCTDHGVARYNGYSFTCFSSTEGLNDNTVFKLTSDTRGRVWMQTFSGQLFYFANNQIHAFRGNQAILDIVKRNIPLSFFVDSTDKVWFTVSTLGEFTIDGKGTLQHLNGYNPDVRFNQIFYDEHTGNNFLTCNTSLAKDDQKTRIYCSTNGVLKDSIQMDDIFSGQVCLRRLKNTQLIIALADRLYRVENDTLYFLNRMPERVSHLYEDDKGRLLLATYKGLYRFKDANFSAEPELLLPDEFVTCVTQDHESGYWITTLYNGVYYLKNDQIHAIQPEELVADKPLSLTAGEQTLYVGLQSGHLLSGTTAGVKRIDALVPTEYINALRYDAATGDIFISRRNPGVFRKGKFVPFEQTATKVLKGRFLRLSNGRVLNQSVNNLFEIRNDSILYVTPFPERSNCIFETANGCILAGTNNGVWTLNATESGCEAYMPSVFNGVRIEDIAGYKDWLLFATRGRGLWIQHSGEFINIREADGLCSNILQKMLVDGNVVWCCSNKGLSRITFQADQPQHYSITNIGRSDGFPENEVNDITLLNDTIWLAAGNKLLFFSKHADFSNRILPKVTLNAFVVNNKDTLAGNNFQLSWNANNISIGFEAISFRSEGDVLYKYTLIHEKDSISSYTTDRHIEFLSMEPGKYALSVSARNSSGYWSSEPVHLEFEILKPMWMRAWFIALFFLLAGGVAVLVIQRRISRIREEERMKTAFNQQLMSLEMKALRAQMNPHFIFNVINSIQDYILKNDSKSAQRYLTKFARLVRSILDNSMQHEVLLADEIKAGELYVELEQQRFDDKFTFEVQIAESLRNSSVVIPSMLLQPYLENAIKHGISHKIGHGTLLLRIEEVEGALLVTIEDNGVGRKASAQWNRDYTTDHISLGTIITAKRVEAYNESFGTHIHVSTEDLTDAEGQPSGTRVRIKIPIRYRT